LAEHCSLCLALPQGGQIQEVQERLADLIGAIEQRTKPEHVRFGLVAYSDHGEEWVTRVSPLSSDRAAIRRAVDEMRASGGGLHPGALTCRFAQGLSLQAMDLKP
jgi:hypothetical protein